MSNKRDIGIYNIIELHFKKFKMSSLNLIKKLRLKLKTVIIKKINLKSYFIDVFVIDVH